MGRWLRVGVVVLLVVWLVYIAFSSIDPPITRPAIANDTTPASEDMVEIYILWEDVMYEMATTYALMSSARTESELDRLNLRFQAAKSWCIMLADNYPELFDVEQCI